MIDEDFGVNLIEINTNPCLETTCPILSKIIPRMLDNAFKIAIDPIFPPADLNFKRGSKSISINLFRLVFDESSEKEYFKSLISKSAPLAAKEISRCSSVDHHPILVTRTEDGRHSTELPYSQHKSCFFCQSIFRRGFAPRISMKRSVKDELLDEN
jgi:hypothetical protein